MKLNEIFDSVTPSVHWEYKEPDGGYAYFRVEGISYEFEIAATELDDGRPAWLTEFKLVDDQGNPRFDTTGSGNALAVYTTVFQLLKEFMAEYGVRALRFEAHDSKRKSLYQRFIRRQLPNWEIEVDGDFMAAYPRSMNR